MQKDWRNIGQNRWFGAEPWNAEMTGEKISFYIERVRAFLRPGGGRGKEDIRYTHFQSFAL